MYHKIDASEGIDTSNLMAYASVLFAIAGTFL